MKVFWNSEDLIASKNACIMLINDGYSLDELLEMDFGNLDVVGVWNEYWS